MNKNKTSWNLRNSYGAQIQSMGLFICIPVARKTEALQVMGIGNTSSCWLLLFGHLSGQSLAATRPRMWANVLHTWANVIVMCWKHRTRSPSFLCGDSDAASVVCLEWQGLFVHGGSSRLLLLKKKKKKKGMGKHNYFSSGYFLGIDLSGQPESSAK